MSPFLFAVGRNSPGRTFAREHGCVLLTGSKQNGPIVCNDRRRADSTVGPNLPQPIRIEAFEREPLGFCVVMRPEQVNGSALATCRRDTTALRFAIQTG